MEHLFVAIFLGLLCGIISSVLNMVIFKIKSIQYENLFLKYFLGGCFLSLTAFLFFKIFEKQDVLFSGMKQLNQILNNELLTEYVLILILLRILAYILTFSFGAIGGQFLPSATIGACLGFLIQQLFQIQEPQVFVLIGMASFISASYNGLLFGPVLIAEITGQPSLVVLGITASTISYIYTNGVSNSQFQKNKK